MKEIKTADAVGQALWHDVTQIIKDVTKDAVFCKGHVIREDSGSFKYGQRPYLYLGEEREHADDDCLVRKSDGKSGSYERLLRQRD